MVRVEVMAALLVDHPSQSLVAFVLSGLRRGFSIGFVGPVTPGREAPNHSAVIRRSLVTAAVIRELRAGFLAGPFVRPPFPEFHCSPVGAADKPDGSARLLLDLSSPRGDSINEGIDAEVFAVQYSSFDDAVVVLRRLGRGAYMAKFDLKNAFRLCPVRRADWPLLCFLWESSYFVHVALPFGSRSSPSIFNRFAQVLWWLLSAVGSVGNLIHYLDDFFFASANVGVARHDFAAALALCAHLGVPLSPEKCLPPARRMVFLGILLDAERMVASLPPERFAALSVLLADWVARSSCSKRELLSLIGSLSFACKVVPAGRLFLRRLIDFSMTLPGLSAVAVLPAEARLDVQWWVDFLPTWDGSSVFPAPPVDSIQLQLYTDASDVGMGGFFGRWWFSTPWSSFFAERPIHVRELVAVATALFLWGDHLRDRQVVLFSDSSAVVAVWQKGSTRDPLCMRIIREVFFFLAGRNIRLCMQHVSGLLNCKADALSRLQVLRFRHLHPCADDGPTPVPPHLWASYV